MRDSACNKHLVLLYYLLKGNFLWKNLQIMKPYNKFKVKDFQLSEELEAMLRKGYLWRYWSVWICGILFVLNCAWYDKVEWLANVKYPWSLLLLFASLYIYIVRIPGKCPVCKRRMSVGGFTKKKHCIIIF